MKEAGVTGTKFPHQIVHCKFEIFRIFLLDDFALSTLSQIRPIYAIEIRIEILFRNLLQSFIEDFAPMRLQQSRSSAVIPHVQSTSSDLIDWRTARIPRQFITRPVVRCGATA